MKKIFTMMVLAIALQACKKSSFLDNKATSALTETTVFADSANTLAFVTRIYEDAPYQFNKQRWEGSGNTEQGTDDGEYTLASPARRAVVVYSGTWTPDFFNFDDDNGGSNGNGFFTTPYINIRRCNLVLSKLPTIPLSAARKKVLEGEIRFMRAWFYHNLIMDFGGVPLIGDQVFGITDDVSIPRSKYADCVDYVAKELDAAAALLPLQQPDSDWGRVTRGAALAIKSRMLLYAASPLFNGGVFPAPSTPDKVALASYPAFDVSRWQKAADAALAVMNLGQYSLFEDNTTAPGYGFYQVFLRRKNSEYIFFYNRPPNREMEGHYNPPSRGGSRNSVPTQSLVDAFPMRNGKAINEAGSGYDPANPYSNRDPRFGYSIIYNGSLYYLTSANGQAVVNTFLGSGSDAYTPNSATTGYYGRKMSDVNIAANSSFNTERGWPLLRYAEIVMNYAEALNELGQTENSVDQLKLIRRRAGITPGTDGRYGIKAGITQAEMRSLLQVERRIEFYAEDHRWDDVRRWKIAMVTQNAKNFGVSITKTGNTFTYQYLPTIRVNTFRENLYILPFPTSELRRNPNLIQNPGW